MHAECILPSRNHPFIMTTAYRSRLAPTLRSPMKELFPVPASVPTHTPHFDVQVVVQNRRADSTDDYLNVARECCALLRTVPTQSQVAAKISSKTQRSTRPDSRAASPVSGAGSVGGATDPGGTGAAAAGGGVGGEGGVADGEGGGKPAAVTTEWDIGGKEYVASERSDR